MLRRLTEHWLVAIVDIEKERLSLIDVDGVEAERVHTTAGDGTSRLVLDNAGIEHADYVIAVTGSDDVNLEVCRLAREAYGKSQLYAAVSNFTERERYREAGIDFVTPSYAAAVSLYHRVLHGVGTSLSKAEARGEIIEVAVLPSSPMIGRSLTSVRSRRWHVAAIYRKDDLVVPSDATRIEVDDRVVLVGEGEILPSIAEFFRVGEPEFPLAFGAQVVVLTESASNFSTLSAELRYILDHSRARGVEILFWPHEPGIQRGIDETCRESGIEASSSAVFGSYGEVAAKHLVKKDCGFLVVPDERFRFLERIGLRRTALSRLLARMEAPVGILRGSHPYEKILVPVTHGTESIEAARLALDLARIYKASVTAITVTPPRFIAGAQAVEEQKAGLDKIQHLANLYHMDVDQLHNEGNPVERVLEIAGDFSLLVLAHNARRKPSVFDPDVSQHLLRRSPVTTIILPV